jgi:hypothetical protein
VLKKLFFLLHMFYVPSYVLAVAAWICVWVFYSVLLVSVSVFVQYLVVVIDMTEV